jgi:aminopeptidase N
LRPPRFNHPPAIAGRCSPSRYALDLTIKPGEDAFRGSVDIGIEARTPAQLIWLSPVAIQIKDATYRAEGGQTAHPQVIPGGEEFTGFSFERPVSGRGTLHVEYEGKVSRNSSAGLFQMKEDDSVVRV